MPSALSVAKELIRLSYAELESDPLTNLRLQKLLYYAQAWAIVVRESELYSEEIQAWRHGPVVPDVYRRLPDGQGASQIAPDLLAGCPNLPGEEIEFVKCVWEAYKQYSATALRQMTHNETPWKKAWGDRPLDGTGNDPIPVADLEEFFAKVAVPAPLAAYEHEARKAEEEACVRLANIPPLDKAYLSRAAKSWSQSARPNSLAE